MHAFSISYRTVLCTSLSIAFFLDVTAQVIKAGTCRSPHSPANTYTRRRYSVSMFVLKIPQSVRFDKDLQWVILSSYSDYQCLIFSVTVPFLCNFAIDRFQ